MQQEIDQTLGGVQTDAAVVANLAMDVATSTAEVKKLDAHPFTINPRTGQPVSLEQFLAKPLAIVENRSFTELESFIAYTTQFKREGAVIFGAGHVLTAILDYHGAPASPEPGKHRATFNLLTTEAYDAWTRLDGKWMSQLDFVEFLEERAKEIRKPAAAAILEIARDLHVVNGATCKSAIRSGADMKVEFTRSEKVTAVGEVSIPTQFLVEIQPFEDQPQTITTLARLRVRAREGNVSFAFSLEEMRRHSREAFKTIAQNAGKAAAVPVFI